MKCPHCCQEHPDSFQFCPATGQRIAPQFKACTNEQCPDFGQYILPLDSRFCPSCGKTLERLIISTISNRQKFNVDGISFNMIFVEHNHLMIGTTEEKETPNDKEKTEHDTILTKDYYIGETLVTQELWTIIMGYNPSLFYGKDRPVENVRWRACLNFIAKLNRRLLPKLSGRKFRLPTEAEWEFAARGGKKTRNYLYAGSDKIDDVAWWQGNCYKKTHNVAKLKPNELGIYDMSGNVSEWCYDYNYSGKHIIRGGSCYNSAQFCKISYRSDAGDGFCNGIGLRLVLSE